MAANRDREERGRRQPQVTVEGSWRNCLPDVIRVTMNDGSIVEINMIGANREFFGKAWQGSWIPIPQ